MEEAIIFKKIVKSGFKGRGEFQVEVMFIITNANYKCSLCQAVS